MPVSAAQLGAEVAVSARETFVLRVVAGPDAGLSCAPAGRRTIIGTDERADLRLSDRTVSRLHCEIVVVDGQLRIRDLASRNGTRVAGVTVTDAFIDGGQIITVGHTQLHVTPGPVPAGEPLAEVDHFGGLVGRSRPMRAAYALLASAAASDATVMLHGETGTGKEAAAEAIHRASRRSAGPFIVIDCGAIPPDLLESELFGHEKGAFTGAHALRPGAFELASGGTVFLDEIGELAPELQPRLLRALERREIKRVGAGHFQSIDVRVIAASNRDLAAEVNAHRFRPDLYYRLMVLGIPLPPLRERLEDLPGLVDHLLGVLAAGADVAAQLRTPAFLAELARHPWPGNVRELRNYLERCIALGGPVALPEPVRRAVTADDTDPGDPMRARMAALEASLASLRAQLGDGPPLADGSVDGATPAAVHTLDRETVIRLLGEHGGHIGRTAKALGVHRRTLERRIKALGLRDG